MTKKEFFEQSKQCYRINGLSELDMQSVGCDNNGNTPIYMAYGLDKNGEPELVDEFFTLEEFNEAMKM